MHALKLAALTAAIAGLTACGAKTAPQTAATAPTPAPATVTVTTKVTPAPTRIVTLDDIIQDCADAMVKANQIPLYDDRPKACKPLGYPEFQRASNIAMPLIMDAIAGQ